MIYSLTAHANVLMVHWMLASSATVTTPHALVAMASLGLARRMMFAEFVMVMERHAVLRLSLPL